jgi:tRNA(Arg) A34 adenosine deaminase TadA
MDEQDLAFLRAAIEVARRARAHGNHPFGALLVDERGRVRLEAENTVVTGRDCTGHAETNLMRLASQALGRDELARCTMYTSAEPCAMCSGAVYWANVGRVVYALSETGLKTLTGDDPGNPTLALPCRDVFARGQKPVQVEGPALELEEEARSVHAGFWDPGK